MKRLFLILFPLYLLLVLPEPVLSQSIAVFPFLDLTKGINGVNYVLTEHVRREISERGHTVIPARDVMDFMVRNRIRTLGKLNRIEIAKSGSELGADLLLLGTVCQLKQEPNATVSMALKLIRSSDTKTVWSVSEDMHQSDLLTLLGINDPERLGDLYGSFFARLFSTFPDGPQAVVEGEDFLDIETVVIRPAVASPGETIHCRVRIKSTMKAEELPKMNIQVNEKPIPVKRDEDGHYFTASWPADNAEGKYTVSLVTDWASGRQESLILGVYQVDNVPPKIALHIIAPKVNDHYAFNRLLVMTTTMFEPEPLSRWQINIYDKDRILLVLQEADGHVPQRLAWNGMTSSGLTSPDGEYLIELMVWDRTGKSHRVEETVFLMSRPPLISFDVSLNDNLVQVKLDNLISTPISFWWLRIYIDNGLILTSVDGEQLPATITFDLPELKSEEKLQLIVEALDVLGNKKKFRVTDLMSLVKVDVMDQDEGFERMWLEEF
jgi:TolB-like protein